jgi:hypothetical protein
MAVDIDDLLNQLSMETQRLQSSRGSAPLELRRIVDQTLKLQQEVLTSQQIALLRNRGQRLHPSVEARRAELIDWTQRELKALQSLSNAIARQTTGSTN